MLEWKAFCEKRCVGTCQQDGTVVFNCYCATTTFHHQQQPPVVLCGADQAVRITASGSKLARSASYREAFQKGFARTTNRTLLTNRTLFWRLLLCAASSLFPYSIQLGSPITRRERPSVRPHILAEAPEVKNCDDSSDWWAFLCLFQVQIQTFQPLAFRPRQIRIDVCIHGRMRSHVDSSVTWWGRGESLPRAPTCTYVLSSERPVTRERVCSLF